MATFYLRTSKATGSATLYVSIRKTNPKVNIVTSSLLNVSIERWKKAKESVSAWKKFSAEEPALMQKMDDINAALENLSKCGIYEKKYIDEAIANIVFSEERAAQAEAEARRKAEELTQAEAERKAEEEARQNPMNTMADFLSDIKSGAKRVNGAAYSPNTIKAWNSFSLILGRFIEQHPFTWQELTDRTADKFLAFLEHEQYMKKSSNKYLVSFKALAYYAAKEGVLSNDSVKNAFTGKKHRINESDKAAEVYLSAEELDALYSMPLDGMKGKVRDVFLTGCFTGQRFSDYSRISAEDFSITAKGTKVVRLIQQKTKNEVIIPVLDDRLLTIAERYDYDLPKVSDVILNRYIKAILKDLSESVPSLKEEYPTLLTMKERAKEEAGAVTFNRNRKGQVVKPKHELITSHSARRTAVTLMYLSGQFNTLQMMAVSGHKDTKTFVGYIKLSGEQVADDIAAAAKNESLF